MTSSNGNSSGNGYHQNYRERVSKWLLVNIDKQEEKLVITYAKPEVIEAVHLTRALEKYDTAGHESKNLAYEILALLIEKTRPEVIKADHLKLAKKMYSKTLFKAPAQELNLAEEIFKTLLGKARNDVLREIIRNDVYEKIPELRANAIDELELRNKQETKAGFTSWVSNKLAYSGRQYGA